MEEVKTPEFNYNKEYAKTLSAVVERKLSAIEGTTTIGYEMDTMFGTSITWSLMQKFVALATRFAQFNSLPKVQSALVGEIQFPSVTFNTNGALTVLNDGTSVLSAAVCDVENVLEILHTYNHMAIRTIIDLERTKAENYNDNREVLAVIKKILNDISREGVAVPKVFQNLKLTFDGCGSQETGGVKANLVIEL